MAKAQTEDRRPPESGGAVVDRMLLAYGCSRVEDLAVAMGLPHTTAKNWRSRGSVPLDYLVQTCRDTGRSLDWLVLAIDPQSEERRADVQAAQGLTLHVSEPETRSWIKHIAGPVSGETARSGGSPRERGVSESSRGALLPVTGASEVRPLVLGLSMGDAGPQLEYEVIPTLCGGANGPNRSATEPLRIDRAGDVAMTYDWLRRHLGHTSGNLASVQVIGDSMQPTLLDGDTIIIDRGVQELSVDAIYVVHMLGQRLVKRVQRKFDGSVVIISDNQAYERETVPRARVAEIEVLGRMVWPRVR